MTYFPSRKEVTDKMHEWRPDWNAYGKSRDSTVDLCLLVVSHLISVNHNKQYGVQDWQIKGEPCNSWRNK